MYYFIYFSCTFITAISNIFVGKLYDFLAFKIYLFCIILFKDIFAIFSCLLTVIRKAWISTHFLDIFYRWPFFDKHWSDFLCIVVLKLFKSNLQAKHQHIHLEINQYCVNAVSSVYRQLTYLEHVTESLKLFAQFYSS